MGGYKVMRLSVYKVMRCLGYKTMRLSILLFLISHFSFLISAQIPMRLSADTIALGDQTTVSGHFDQLWGDAIVLVSQRFDSIKSEQQAVVTSFEPGEHWIHYSPSDSLPLVVTDVDVDTTTTEIRDIAPIVLVPHTFWEIFRWVLLALGIIALALLGWWIVTHRQKLQQVLGAAEPVDTRTPEERALDNLEALRRRQLWQAGKTKEYHTELTDIVRQFIEESTGIRATEMTSDETIEEVRREKGDGRCDLLRNIFTTADLVKFAKSEPLPHEHDRSMNEAVTFVKALWEQVKPQETEDKGEIEEEKEGKGEGEKERRKERRKEE